VRSRLPSAFGLNLSSERFDEVGNGPTPVAKRGPAPPNRVIGQAEKGQRRDHSASTLEQATAEECPQQKEEIKVCPGPHPTDNTQQQLMNPIH
jgi:hypothetical protein